MEALKIPFQDKDIAMHDISETVLKYYKDEHPEVLKSDEQRVLKAIAAIQGEYKLNAFPYMRADASQIPQSHRPS